MIAEQIQQSYAKYYQFYTVATILEHVIDCFHTIVSDESNPYHPPLSWLSRKQPQPPEDELFLDLIDECSKISSSIDCGDKDSHLNSSTRIKLERCSIESRKNIVSRTKDGCSPLFMACKFGLLNKASYLLEICAADIEQKGHYEAFEDNHIHLVPPIWVAAVSGHLDVVKLLVANGADINSLSDTGSTPLRSVCFMCTDDDGIQRHPSNDEAHFMDDDNNVGSTHHLDDIYLEIVMYLVQNGADISRPNYNGGTCLINSIHNLKLTRFLLDNGADIDACDNQAKTALHYAIQQNRLEVTKLLITLGANPSLYANSCDDALQLSCIGGHTEIFNYLVQNVNFPTGRLIDAYKLLGSSILELHYDLAKVRELWLKALELQQRSSHQNPMNLRSQEDISLGGPNEKKKICDTQRRIMAYGDSNEFSSESELQSLSVDDYRIQALLISERILGTDHRETVQRLLYRGTSYINSLRPERCVNFWIYALQLRLSHESVFHFESIFAAQAITKLFLDLISQHKVKFEDAHYVLELLVEQIEECKRHLKQRPVSHLHEEIHDMLLGIIVYLLFVLNTTAKEPNDYRKVIDIINKLVELNPQLSDGSSLLHVCVSQTIIESIGSQCRMCSIEQRCGSESSIVQLIDLLVENGMDVDSPNSEGLSPLQVLCLAGMRVSDKRPLIKRLISHGAHVDRGRSGRTIQEDTIRMSLVDSGINLMDHIRLSCLAARQVAEMKFTEHQLDPLADCLRKSVSIH